MKTVLPLLLAAAGAAAGPCDIYGAANTPCVAAHSMTRALYDSYAGPLYQVQRASDMAVKDITLLAVGGTANASVQDAFCGTAACEVTRIYDQSPRGNHLDKGPPGGAAPHPDNGVNATRHPITLGGKKVYGAHFEGGMGYRNDKTSGIAVGNAEEAMYMVIDGTVYNGGCCFDYGNAETNNNDDGDKTMEAIYWGNSTGWGHGAGNGPWIMADMENGLWAGDTKVNENNPSMTGDYITAMVKGGTNGFGLRGGNAQSGPLNVLYQGSRPAGYQPMEKQGAIILGIGGDNSNRAIGVFFEGAMTAALADDSVDAKIHADIQAAGYGK